MDRIDYQEIFEQSVSFIVIVKPDFSVLSASDGFLQLTGNDRDSVSGRYIFDLFPKSQPDIQQVLINTMRESFKHVIKSKKAEISPVVRYDIPKGDPENGDYEVRYWKAINTPILDQDQNVKYIKQRYLDITDSNELSAQVEAEKKNLDEYKTAEEYIRNAFKQAPAPICVLRGPEHIIEMASRKFLRIVADREIIGKPIREVVPEIEGQGFFKALDKVYETEKAYYGSEMPITFNYGENRISAFVDFTFQVLFDSKGNKTGIFVLGLDVTKQVYARKKAEDSEYRYRLLIEKSTVAMALFTGPEFIVQYANNKMLAFWGKDETVLNKPLHKALPELKGQQFHDKLKRVYETGEMYTGTEEKAKLVVDGKLQTFYFDYTYTALRDKDGEIYGIQNIAINVTEKVQAKKALEKREENLKRLLDSMPQKISHTDKEGNVVFFNQQWLNETGYTSEELKGTGWIEKVHPDDFPEVKEKWVNAVQECSSLEVEFRISHKDLGYRWNLTRSVPIYDENGEVMMWIASSTDIHEQKKQKETLEKAVRERTKELEQANKELIKQVHEKEKQKKELEAVNKELESFAYISSHDLQEPLRKIQTFAGRIREKENPNLSEKGKNYFRRLEDSADRMRILIEDLLYFSRVNNAEDNFKLINLEIIVNEVIEEFSEVIEEKNAVVEVTELCESNFIVFQLRQLLRNLLSNALKFSKPDTPPHIILTSRILKGRKLINKYPSLPTDKFYPEQYYCHIIFEDNGIGFDIAYKERIFEVFQRLHREEYTGTGIGLAIVKKIVDNHNGLITAESEPGKGSRFDIYIPVKQESG